MTKLPPTTAEALQALFDYLGDDKWDLGDLIFDACDGADVLNLTTARLLRDLFDSMPDSDNLEITAIHENIKAVGTNFAQITAQDLADAAELCHEHSSDPEVCEDQH